MKMTYETPALELISFESAESITVLSSFGPIDNDPNSHARDNEINSNTWG